MEHDDQTEGNDASADNQLEGDVEELLVQPEPVTEHYEQDEWMEALRPINAGQETELDEGANHDDAEFLVHVKTTDWQEDARNLNLYQESFKELEDWVQTKKNEFPISIGDNELGGLPTDLNDKQFIAFAIIRDFILKVDLQGLDSVPSFY